MDPFLKDVLQAATWIVGVVGALLTAWRSIYDRRAEFRWRRANKAKELIDQIHNHPFAHQAVHMLDWHNANSSYEYAIKEGVRKSICYMQVIHALNQEESHCKSDIDIFIHDCFDWFFYLVDRIEHSINRGFIDRLDVAPIFKPYVSVLSHDWPVFERFLSSHRYDYAVQFFQHYEDFKVTQAPNAAAAGQGS